MAERTNYCYLLGLNPLKEESYKPEDIRKKIAKARETWANESRNKQNDTEKRFKSERLVEATEDMEKVFADPVLRHKEFVDGANLLKGRSMKLLQDCIVLTDGRKILIPGTIDGFMKKLHWDGVKEDDVIKLAGVLKEKPPEPASTKVQNAFKSLRTVDTYTVVELLNRLIGMSNLEIGLNRLTEGSSLSQLRTSFDVCEKRVNNVRPDVLPDQDSYINCLRTVKLILNDDAQMDELAELGRCHKMLAPAISNMELEYTGRQFTRDYFDKLLRAAMGSGADTRLALKILQQTCYKKKWPANFSDQESEMDRCPHCGFMVPSGPDTIYCSACGKELRIVCPSCGTAQPVNSAVCVKCGFNFKEGMQRAKILELNITSDLSKGMVIRAEKNLAELKRIFPGHPNLTAMTANLEKAKIDMASMKRLFNDAYSKKKYNEARLLCEDLTSKYPEALMEDLQLNHKYRDAKSKFDSAEIYCRKALACETVQESIGLYITAIGICPDHPAAKDRLREYPPAEPEDVKGKLENGVFKMEFVPPTDAKDVMFCVYRSRNSRMLIDEESRPLAEIPGTTFEDKNMDPGVPFYYSVYSKRWGVLSREGCHIGPVVLLAEVDGIMIEQIEGGLKLIYNRPRGCSRVRVWRDVAFRPEGANSSSLVELPVNDEPVYEDIGLEGGVQYSYLFVAEYDMRDGTERSLGTRCSGTPLKLPKPITNIAANWDSTDGTFTAHWSTQEKVVLYYSTKRIILQGSLNKKDDMNTWFKEIVPLVVYRDGIKFSVPDGQVIYLYPSIPVGNLCVVGPAYMLANLRPFRDLEKIISNRDCIITMDWPDGCVGAKIVVSDDGFKPGDDKTAEQLYVTKEQYQQDRLVRIPMGRSLKKYITVYAMYMVESQRASSKGIALEVYSGDCKKVRYSMESGRSSASISFVTDPSVDALPPMVAVRASDGIPLKRGDGEVVWSSEGPVALAEGRAKVDLPPKSLSDKERIRVFFEKDGDYNLYRFIHPLYGRRARWPETRRRTGREGWTTSARTASTTSTSTTSTGPAPTRRAPGCSRPRPARAAMPRSGGWRRRTAPPR